MLHYAMRLDDVNKSLSDIPKLAIYNEFYGYTSKDLGLYALVDNQLAGAVWIRRLNADHGSNGYIDENTPILNMAVLPDYRGRGLGSQMIEQLFIEAGALYEQISVSVVHDSAAIRFYERHGFVRHDNGSVEQSFVDGNKVITLVKKLQKATVVRPSDGYDPRRWMD
ncbi:MAG: GNAT family N-acetyltransferase [Sulfuricurvum sp. RIFOXYD2_FULL_44_160]|uniref:GNAT family N-acetyltransferase n=2 Tax=Sulfurimonadaceae TaxID=2771471 RepID=A0A2D3WLK1_9BACT|nr:MAG: GNAT family N-acetyltransferase [Sulfuricurvum sp. RIFOXYD12_FULL_44_77]OHD99575.1 MAG: GNAT family N-acetyltransferase [Sulfuricurvum sp. RIFOXYD2_FULL_44_160]DAB39186.1 MAG TPA: GNAT family N-acetyltransferase [Sulfuricurvum kujiense]